jgi:eukaryotic-like serine/threonine-protein kinase
VKQGPQQVSGVAEGQILAGKYRVESFIAIGGMGAVVSAHHLQLDVRVAIKLLLPSMLANQEAVARFSREARAAVKITNEHVARVLDVGTLDTGAPFMVMEFLQGSDLGTRLHEHGPLDPHVAVGFVLQACEAIAEAHSLGIIHRDLKPSNLFCIKRADGRDLIKVLDFGISKITGFATIEPNITLMLASGVMGSPLYMSPEQMESSHTVDARADIWALGVILYELLTGNMPFCGNTLPEISVKIASRPPPPLVSAHTPLPDGLQAAIFRCLEKDREKRFASVPELAEALLPFAPEGSAASVRRIAAIGRPKVLSSPEREPPGEAARTILPEGGDPPARRRRQTLGRMLAVGAVLALALGITLATRRPRQSPEDASRVTAISSPTVTNPIALRPATPPPEPLAPIPVEAVPPSALRAPSATGDRSPGPAPRPKAAYAVSKSSVPSATPGPSSAPNCEPNFVLDDQGRKHFKPECWTGPAAPGIASGAGKSECDPNFILDDQGRKHFKRECFLNQTH